MAMTYNLEITAYYEDTSSVLNAPTKCPAKILSLPFIFPSPFFNSKKKAKSRAILLRRHK